MGLFFVHCSGDINIYIFCVAIGNNKNGKTIHMNWLVFVVKYLFLFLFLFKVMVEIERSVHILMTGRQRSQNRGHRKQNKTKPLFSLFLITPLTK